MLKRPITDIFINLNYFYECLALCRGWLAINVWACCSAGFHSLSCRNRSPIYKYNVEVVNKCSVEFRLPEPMPNKDDMMN